MTEVKRLRIDNITFANTLKEVAESNGTLQDVAEKLGLKMESVYQRYNMWRNKGVKVPHIPMKPATQRRAREFDTEALSSIFN